MGWLGLRLSARQQGQRGCAYFRNLRCGRWWAGGRFWLDVGGAYHAPSAELGASSLSLLVQGPVQLHACCLELGT